MVRKTKEFIQSRWGLTEEDERAIICEWSRVRHEKMQKLRKKYYNKFLLHTFNFYTCKSFIKNFNFMVILQMLLAALSVYVFKYFDISFDFHVSLFVSPIVFPLAFSINTDFQRREKVLEDLANFKSSAMLWFFCMREWKEGGKLTDEWLNAVHLKVKNMMFNLREYLLTDKIERRQYIARCLYEDFSDANQLIERVRASDLPANTSIVSRVIHLLNMLCLSFERLRVIREYRSPRSIRSFNKVLILFLPIILSPYFVYLSKKDYASGWSPYYIAVLVAAVFGALQGVQDKLDDPFDGMSEDDIKLQTIDEWTFNTFDVVKNRNFTVGRFHVSANIDEVPKSPKIFIDRTDQGAAANRLDQNTGGLFNNRIFKKSSSKKRSNTIRRNSTSRAKPKPTLEERENHNFDPQNHPYAEALQNIKGNSRVQAVKGTGKVLVTDLVSNADKLKSESLDESRSSTPTSFNRTIATCFHPANNIFQSKINDATSDQSETGTQTTNQPETNIVIKEPISCTEMKIKDIKFSVHKHPEITTSLDESESESNFSTPSKQPLIIESPSSQSNRRFKLKSISPANCSHTAIIELDEISRVIENNNTNTDIRNNGDKKPADESNDLEEIIITSDSVSNDLQKLHNRDFVKQ